jgi:hypothetical protein
MVNLAAAVPKRILAAGACAALDWWSSLFQCPFGKASIGKCWQLRDLPNLACDWLPVRQCVHGTVNKTTVLRGKIDDRE